MDRLITKKWIVPKSYQKCNQVTTNPVCNFTQPTSHTFPRIPTSIAPKTSTNAPKILNGLKISTLYPTQTLTSSAPHSSISRAPHSSISRAPHPSTSIAPNSSISLATHPSTSNALHSSISSAQPRTKTSTQESTANHFYHFCKVL